MKQIIKIFLLVVFIILVIWGLYYLWDKSREKEIVFKTKQPSIDNIIKKTVATGSVVPRKEIDIKPQISGIIEKLYVEAGDKVKQGDLLAKVKIIPNMVSLNNAESRLKKAKLMLEDTKIVYDRQKNVFEEGVIAEADFQKYRVDYFSAIEEVESAENNLQLIREGAIKKAGKSTNTLIKSTIEGMVLDVPVEIGNSVIEANTFNAGTTIATVADMGEMIFEGKVDETEVGKIKEGMPLLLSIGAIENNKFDAILEYISPKGVEENGAIQFEIKADVTIKENVFIRAGYSANADIVLNRRDSVIVIPESLLNFEEDSDSSFVEIETAPQKFEKRHIKTGLSDGINIEIIEGLTKEDKIKVPNS